MHAFGGRINALPFPTATSPTNARAALRALFPLQSACSPHPIFVKPRSPPDLTNNEPPDNANLPTTSPPRNAYGKRTSLTVWSNRST
jgi:hypothetical protein